MVAIQAVMDKKPVALKTEPASGTPAPPKAPKASAPKPNVFASVNLDELMKILMKNIQAWVAEYSAQLTPQDVEAVIA
jgi:hypothetical protein